MNPSPTVVIAGECRPDRGRLAGALLGGVGATAADRVVAAGAYTVYRHGDRPAARAFIPGLHEPRTLVVDAAGTDVHGALLAGVARPPRRIELVGPVELLRWLTLVDAPDLDALDQAFADVTSDVVGHDGVLLFVVDGSRPLRATEIEFLAQAALRRTSTVFAVIGGDPDPTAAADRRRVLESQVPTLATAPWFPVDLATDPAALRAAVVGLATAERPEPAPAPPAREPVDAGSEAWHAALDRGVGRCRLAVLRQLAAELGDAQEHCERRTARREGFRDLPVDLDRELHGLSVRLTAALDSSLRLVAERTVATALGHRPGPEVLDRVAGEVRATWTEGPEKVLLVTSTGGVTTFTGPGARDNLSARPARTDLSIVRPIDVALTAGSCLLWTQRANAHPAEVALWLQRAVDSVAADLLDEVVQRCYEVHRGLVRSIGGLAQPVPAGGPPALRGFRLPPSL